MTIVLKRVSVPTEYGVAMTDSKGKIYRFLEKPMLSEVFSDLANTGIYILEPEVIERIPEGEKYDFSKGTVSGAPEGENAGVWLCYGQVLVRYRRYSSV